VRDDQVPPPAEDPVESEEPQGNLRPTPPGVVVGWAVVGLVGGWGLHAVSDRMGNVPPLVSWAQPLALLLLAAILAYVAWATWRTVHVRRERLLPHQAVNRLVLARACMLVAALVGGGYLGYGLSWIGGPEDNGRLWPSLAGGGAGLLGVAAALLLERACRIRNTDNSK
jgi:4-amino-4-deoxy-L-arabinose transferase-like glycosyltransferase